MKTEDARLLKTGQRVQVPKDSSQPGRVQAAYVGIIEEVGEKVHPTHAGDDGTYIWVLVQHPQSKVSSMWPSHRLEVAQ